MGMKKTIFKKALWSKPRKRFFWTKYEVLKYQKSNKFQQTKIKNLWDQ